MRTRAATVASEVRRPTERRALATALKDLDLSVSDNVLDLVTEAVHAGAITADYLMRSGRRSQKTPVIEIAYVMESMWEEIEPRSYSSAEALNWIDHSLATLAAFSPSQDELLGTASHVAPASVIDEVDELSHSSRPSDIRQIIQTGRLIRSRTGYRARDYAAGAKRPWNAIQSLNSSQTDEGVRVVRDVAGQSLDWGRLRRLVEGEHFSEKAATWAHRHVTQAGPRAIVGEAKAPSPATDAREMAKLQFDAFEAAQSGKHDQQGARFMVWYGTDRAVGRSGTSVGYANRPSRPRVVEYGRCLVNIPTAHQFGKISSSWWDRVVRGRDDQRLRLEAVLPFTGATEFAASINDAFTATTDDKSALLYVHGYNVTFENAAIRAAQIGFDLRVAGPTAFYSWPSAGRAHLYGKDADNIPASERAFTEFVRVLTTQTEVTRLNLIVHSMGNRLVTNVLDRMSAQLLEQGVSLGNIILAAPDVNTDVFRQVAAIFPRLSASTTMYVSDRDKALDMSRTLWNSPRAGFTPPVTVVSGVDTIDVGGIDMSRIGHGYYAAAHPVLYDIRAILDGARDPARRLRLVQMLDSSGPYWRLAP